MRLLFNGREMVKVLRLYLWLFFYFGGKKYAAEFGTVENRKIDI